MVEIKGTFTNAEGKPAVGARLSLTLQHDDPKAEFKVIEEGEEVDYSGESFMLGSSGELPVGASVRGVDEIQPAGSRYSIEFEKIVGTHSRHCYSRVGVEIKGETFDLTPPIEVEPALVIPKAPRQMPPSPRKLGVNYRGWFAGVPFPPALGICTSPRDGTLPALTFSLSTRTVVSVASIRVLVPCVGKRVLIALYDTNGDRVCSTSIPADTAGIATSALERTMPLNAGEYTLVWLTERAEVQGIDFGPGQRDEFSLMNAGEGGVAAGATIERYDCSDGSLPERIGEIAASTFWVPPLVYFKS